MILGSRIAALRKSAGLSQAALASRIGVSPSAIGMYEQGRREPSGDLLIALSRQFNVSVDYLLTGRKPTVFPAPPLTQLEPLSREDLIVLIAAQLLEGL